MAPRTGIRAVLGPAAALLAATTALLPGEAPGRSHRPQEPELVKAVAVAGAAGWVDTGVEVAAGDRLLIRASGRVSLQTGNPAAECGPEGLDAVTVQQPLPNVNVGALIGKFAQVVAVREDPDTGQPVQDEVFSLFYVGPEAAVTAAVRGRLFLGVNENVFKDNAGEFSVQIFRRPA